MALTMITRTQAAAIANAFVAAERDRAIQWLTNRAQGGDIGGTYTVPGQVPMGNLAPVKTELEGAGWTVVVDAPNRTVTIS